jgi:hypothetical protein
VLSSVRALLWFTTGSSKLLSLCSMNMPTTMGRDMKPLVAFGLGDRYNFRGLGARSRTLL